MPIPTAMPIVVNQSPCRRNMNRTSPTWARASAVIRAGPVRCDLCQAHQPLRLEKRQRLQQHTVVALKIAEVAPMPSASVRTAAAAKTGCFGKTRAA